MLYTTHASIYDDDDDDIVFVDGALSNTVTQSAK